MRLQRWAGGLKRGKSLYKGGGSSGVRGPCPSEMGGRMGERRQSARGRWGEVRMTQGRVIVVSWYRNRVRK